MQKRRLTLKTARLQPILLVLSLLAVGTTAATPAGGVERVVLISIDGLVPEVYLETQGPALMPVLSGLLEAGSGALAVESIYPSQTYPAHTSLVSGAYPDRHGIYSNTFLLADASESWFFDFPAIRAQTIWEAARAAGLKTGAVSWPVTVGAPIDFLIPETHQDPPGSSWLELVRSQSTPGLVEAVVAALGGYGAREHLVPERRDAFVTEAACFILAKYRPRLLGVHLAQADFAQHDFGRGAPQAVEAFRRIDDCLKKIIQVLQENGIYQNSALVVVGDHGFENVHSVLRPNVLLREMGLIEPGPDGRISGWKAFFNRGALRFPASGSDGASAERDSLLSGRIEQVFRDLSKKRYRGTFSVVGREELANLGADPHAGFLLEPGEGYVVADSFAGYDFVVPATRLGTHGGLPTKPTMLSGLVLAGKGIRPGVVLPKARLVDIAPTVAVLLGFSLPDAEGVPVVAVLSREVLEAAGNRGQ